MTTLNITLAGICAGGEHLTFAVTGDRTATVVRSLEAGITVTI